MSYQADWFKIMDGSHEHPFTQNYLNNCMKMRIKRRGMYNLPSPQELLDRFIEAQAEKYRSDIQLKCSPGLLLEIKRKDIVADLGI